MQSLFVFDFDGVFADTLDFYYDLNRIVAPKFGIPSSKRFFLDALRKDVYVSLLSAGISEVTIVKYRHDFKVEMLRNIDKVMLYPFTKEFILNFSKTAPIPIVSHNEKAVITKILQNYGLRECVKDILGNEADPRKAVKLERLKNKYKAEKYFFVGDTPSDILAAQQVGMVSIAVTWGFFGKKDLQGYKPDVVLSRPGQLVEYIESHK